jgi:outer membrane protein assembly factor BamD
MIKNFFFIFLLIVLNACNKSEFQIENIKEKKQDLEMISTYKEAYEAMNEGDPFYAAKKFLEAELLYPQSKWAPKSALMASYSYYMQNYYAEAISNLDRYLKTYPSDKNHSYAYYLKAMCYYESITDEKRDAAPLLKAKENFSFIVKNYPQTEFASDAVFKLNLIEDILASKEMYLGRHYIKKEKWIAAINRFKVVLDEYDKTIFVEEALHRLVEINYKIGLLEESRKYANLLGYNYLSSNWYKKSFKVFNEDYEIRTKKLIEKNKGGITDKFKKLFD